MIKSALLLGYDKYKDTDELEEGGIFDFDENCDLIKQVQKKSPYVKMIEGICYYSILGGLIILTYYCFTIKIK
jgi:hypothetical protein